ncbi:hypothetical protein V7O66_01735 [Methanolobus sp. ZRKC3]|uniref:hypothetical protein n=1 Tax=Methanolobus sp. ZRKC3 TaxID=3125786 RepID=UPI003247EA00
MIKNNIETLFPIHLLESINGKSLIFRYSEDVKMPAIISGIVSDIHNYFQIPIIYLYREEKSENIIQNLNGNVVVLEISRNLTSTMMKLEKLLFGNRHIVIIDELEDLLLFAEGRANQRFLETLIRKSSENQGILLSSYKNDSLDATLEKSIVKNYDIAFDVDTNMIIMNGASEREQINYLLTDTGLSIRSAPSTDTDKIKELFRLTPEEREELDMIVGEQIKELDLS